MKIERLELQQYIEKHAIMEIKSEYRIGYLELLKGIFAKYGKNDKWSRAVMTLFYQQLIGETNVLENNKKDGSAAYKARQKNRKYFKYRYNLVVDALFICAFDNPQKGKKIQKDICKLFPRNKKKIASVCEYFYKENLDGVEEFETVSEILKILNKNRNFLKQKEKRIMITANMSAGKSTLLNALVGKKINKTQNDTCTAKIHYLYNKAGEDNLSYEYDHDLELNATNEILMTDNDKNKSTEISVGTRFRSIREIEQRICFIDTPGVNSALNQEHTDMTQSMVREGECDLLIYLLNGENIGTDDDMRHLKYVTENYHGKIIFLINKMDKYKKGVDSVESTMSKVEKDLKKLGYEKPYIYPISAYGAYLAKMKLYGEILTEDEEDDLALLKRKLSREEFQYDKYYDTDNINVNETSEELLLKNAGILSLEQILYK